MATCDTYFLIKNKETFGANFLVLTDEVTEATDIASLLFLLRAAAAEGLAICLDLARVPATGGPNFVHLLTIANKPC